MDNLILNSNSFLEEENDYNIKYLSDNQILSIFKLSEDTPCLNPKEKTWKYHYKLEPKSKNCITKINDQKYDNRYIQLSKFSTSKYDLYNDNGIIDFDEEYSNNETVYLYARNIMGFEGNKIKKFSYDDLISLEKLSNRCGRGMYVLSIIMISIICFPIFIVCGGGVSNQCDERSMECFCNFYLWASALSIIGTFLINIIFCIIIMINNMKMKSILDIKESDIFTNQLIEDIMNEYSRNFKFSMASVITFLCSIFIGIATILISLASS